MLFSRAGRDPASNIDVFLPTYGEDLAVLRNTYTHVKAMQWAAGTVDVYVLDDGDRSEVRELATQFGFHYIVRPNRGYLKKAGNLQYAFARTSGDYIVILDADFCPRPDFLRHLVPYFDDPAIGIVQSPQYFDSGENLNWIQRTAGATQELFYRWILPSRDRFDAASASAPARYTDAKPSQPQADSPRSNTARTFTPGCN